MGLRLLPETSVLRLVLAQLQFCQPGPSAVSYTTIAGLDSAETVSPAVASWANPAPQPSAIDAATPNNKCLLTIPPFEKKTGTSLRQPRFQERGGRGLPAPEPVQQIRLARVE